LLLNYFKDQDNVFHDKEIHEDEETIFFNCSSVNSWVCFIWVELSVIKNKIQLQTTQIIIQNNANIANIFVVVFFMLFYLI